MRPILLLFLDIFVVAAAAILALLLRDNFELAPDHALALVPYVLFAFCASVIVLPAAGVNRTLWHYSTFNDFLRIGFAVAVVVLAATTATFALNRLEGLARAVPVLHLIIAILLMCAVRSAARILHATRSRPVIPATVVGVRNSENVLVVGINAVAELFVRSAREFAGENVHVAGIVGLDSLYRGRQMHGAPVVGLVHDLPTILRQLEVHGVKIERIVVATAPSDLSRAAREALAAVESGSEIAVDYFAERLGFAGPPRAAALVEETDERPLPSLRELVDHAGLKRPYWQAKRAFDFVVSFVLLVLTLPVMMLVAVAVALDVGGPVLFWQERPGAFGKRLRLHKFRTMRPAHDADGARIPESERSSAIGRFLRRTRLDELPQLFNILSGEMSFVGPRPLLPVDQSPSHSGRLAIRPGLTGWAQVHGGREVGPADKAAMDLWYIRNASFRLDFLIAMKTVRMIVLGEQPDAGAIDAAWRDAAAWRSRHLRKGDDGASPGMRQAF